VEYPIEVANIAPVHKKDGRVRMCVDIRDLNKASLKDNFPLLHIDIMIHNTTGDALLSFMNRYPGYKK